MIVGMCVEILFRNQSWNVVAVEIFVIRMFVCFDWVLLHGDIAVEICFTIPVEYSSGQIFLTKDLTATIFPLEQSSYFLISNCIWGFLRIIFAFWESGGGDNFSPDVSSYFSNYVCWDVWERWRRRWQSFLWSWFIFSFLVNYICWDGEGGGNFYFLLNICFWFEESVAHWDPWQLCSTVQHSA